MIFSCGGGYSGVKCGLYCLIDLTGVSERMAAPHEVLSALGDPTRLTMVWRLATNGPMPQAKLTQGLPMSRQGASKHLNTLVEADIVHIVKKGKRQILELNAASLEDSKQWMDLLATEWSQKNRTSRRRKVEAE